MNDKHSPRAVRAARAGRVLPAVAALAALLVGTAAARAQAVRDYISIVGSSTVYPFATVVAERFGRGSEFKTPKIESTGTGGGFRLFCAGVGVEHPDIANASRRITASEVAQCAANGVKDIVEVKIGYDGIAVANSKSSPRYALTRRELYLALAKSVPDPSGAERFVANPYRTWADIDPNLPAVRIEVLGPPPTSGTRDAFVELVMEPGCHTFEWTRNVEDRAACQAMREDNAYIEAGENDNLIVQKLEANPTQLGIFGFSFLDQNADKVQGAAVEGVPPTFDSIADGSYPIARPLFFYVKAAHVDTIRGIREYLAEFTSDAAWGDFGYLTEKGLIPLPDDERAEVAARVSRLEKFDLAAEGG